MQEDGRGHDNDSLATVGRARHSDRSVRPTRESTAGSPTFGSGISAHQSGVLKRGAVDREALISAITLRAREVNSTRVIEPALEDTFGCSACRSYGIRG
jgi:hypothetical protein